jgi:hypothetical protein
VFSDPSSSKSFGGFALEFSVIWNRRCRGVMIVGPSMIRACRIRLKVRGSARARDASVGRANDLEFHFTRHCCVSAPDPLSPGLMIICRRFDGNTNSETTAERRGLSQSEFTNKEQSLIDLEMLWIRVGKVLRFSHFRLSAHLLRCKGNGHLRAEAHEKVIWYEES